MLCERKRGLDMRRTNFLLVIVFLLIATAASAVEVVLFPSQQFDRTTGKPNVYVASFPALPGQAALAVLNGDSSGDHRVSSAVLTLNGQVILGPSDFNQKNGQLAVNIQVGEWNELILELRSKPGSFLTIAVQQDVSCAAAAVIGPLGGTLTVTDANSPIVGVALTIPANALKQLELIRIDGSRDVTSPNSSILLSLLPTGLTLSPPATLTVPYDPSAQASRIVFQAFSASESGPLFTGPSEASRFSPLTSLIAADHTETLIPHFSWVSLFWGEPLYTVLRLPGRYLLEGDLVYAMALVNSSPPGGFSWFPGHAAMYLGTQVATNDLGQNDGSTVIEAVPNSNIQTQDLAHFFEEQCLLAGTVTPCHLYLGARRPRASLSADTRFQVARYALDALKRGAHYSELLPGPSAKGPDFYTCVGLTEASYEEAGIDIIPDTLEWLKLSWLQFPWILPNEQFNATEPVNSITVMWGDDVAFEVGGVLFDEATGHYKKVPATAESPLPVPQMHYSNGTFTWHADVAGVHTVHFFSSGVHLGNNLTVGQPVTIIVGPGETSVVLLKGITADATVDYFRNLLTTAGIPFDEVGPSEVTGEKLAHKVVVAGFTNMPAEYSAKGDLIRTAVENGSWLLTEGFGGFLLQWAGIGTAGTGGWYPAVQDKYGFVKPIDSSPLFDGLPTWDPPALPDDPEHYFNYLIGSGWMPTCQYTPPSSGVELHRAWGIAITYGWPYQSTSSTYCVGWGGCTPDRSVGEGEFRIISVGAGKVMAPPKGVGVLPGRHLYGAASDILYKNFVEWARRSIR
jgi:hypothetical protein